VVPEDLLLFLDAVAGDPLEPIGEPLVQLSPQLLRHRLVRLVADQQVAEAERLLTGQRAVLGTDQLLAHERHQRRAEPVSLLRRGELLDRTEEEALPDRRRPLGDGPLLRRQPVET
jgi:hypothetical protein